MFKIDYLKFEFIVDSFKKINTDSNKKFLIYFSVLLFPVVIATVDKVGSALFLLLFLMSLSSWAVWKKLEDWEKKVLIGFVVFFLLVSLSAFNAQDISGEIKKLGRFMHFPLIIPIVLLVRKHKIDLGEYIFISLPVSSLVMFGVALYEVFVLHYPRAVGSYNPIVLGDTAMLIAVLTGAALVTIVKQRRTQIIAALAIGLALYASIASGTRGGWVFLPVYLVWMLWMFRVQLGRKRLLVLSVSAVLVLSVFLSLSFVENRVDRTLSEIHIYMENPSINSSLAARLNMWRDSIAIWQAHPIIGTGLADFRDDSIRLHEQGISDLNHGLMHAHSIYFGTLAATGIVGFVAMMVFMLWWPYQMFYRHWHNEADSYLRFYALAGMTTILAFAVFGLSEEWLGRNPLVRTYLMFILVFMTSIAVRREELKKVGSRKLEVVSRKL